VWSNSGTKKQLDFRGAFRHVTYRPFAILPGGRTNMGLVDGT
jgi:hypothetical protein